jgi:hypothetical protein
MPSERQNFERAVARDGAGQAVESLRYAGVH